MPLLLRTRLHGSLTTDADRARRSKLALPGLALLLLAACGPSETDEPGATGATGATGGSGATGATGGSSGAGKGGSSGAGGTSGGSTSGAFNDVKVELSSKIPTVGIVTWSSSSALDSAFIEFGRDMSAFEYQAPVDLEEPSYRTLLLGMKADTQYYARISAVSGGKTLTSDVIPLKTGFLPNGLPQVTVTDHDASALYAGGGFTLNCTGLSTGGLGGLDPGGTGGASESYAFAFDKDGDQVWAFGLTDSPVEGCSRARMSPDGKYLWVGNFNNASTMGAVIRVSMDGLEEPKTIPIRARNHDFAFFPNGNLLYWEQQNGGGYTTTEDGMRTEGPDTIREMNPDTLVVTDLYDQTRDFAEQIEEKGSHTNQANFVPELNAISFSLRHTSTIGLISYPGGELLGIFGGPNTTFAAMDWTIQHGHDVHADHLWVFNNQGENGGSSVLGFDYDLGSGTATSTLTYDSGASSGAFGDVKELPNGNLYVTYSTSGVLHAITQSGTLLRELKVNGSLGYSEHRATLYGPPPPFATE
jgi:hypothetical protein